MSYRLEIRLPDGATGTPGVVLERFSAGAEPRIFSDLAAACDYLAIAFPKNELRMEPDGWYVVVFGGEVARLVSS